MGYRIYWGADEVEYDALKHTLVIDEVLGEPSRASVTVKHVDTIVGMTPVQIACNTTSSLTFGGVVRNWSLSRKRGTDPITYDIELDDWTPHFNRTIVRETYSSVSIDSIVRHIVYARVGGYFNSIGVHTMVCESRSLTWDKVTVTYDGTVRNSDLITSLVAMQTPPDPYDPPAWRLTPDKVVHLVGAVSSLGPTVTVDDSNLDLLRFEVQEVGTQDLGAVTIYGGYAQVVYQKNAGASSLAVYEAEKFWGPAGNFPALGTNTLYVKTPTRELIPVVNIGTLTGIGIMEISTLTDGGDTHVQISMPNTVQAYLLHTAPATSLAVTSLITGEPWWTTRTYIAADQGWSTNPITLATLAHSLTHVPGQELGLLRVVTTNSQATPGGRLAVSLTAAGHRQGVYPIRRVRISGFDRGENLPPLYEIEAGVESRYRIDSLL